MMSRLPVIVSLPNILITQFLVVFGELKLCEIYFIINTNPKINFKNITTSMLYDKL